MSTDILQSNTKQQIRVEIQHGKLVARKQEQPKKDTEEEARNLRNSMRLASGLGFSIVFPMIGGIFLGKLIDRYAQTDGTFTVICLFVGGALGIANMLVLLKKD